MPVARNGRHKLIDMLVSPGFMEPTRDSDRTIEDHRRSRIVLSG